jgi:predicted SnoaL-like aldol condensation-catalyzing enzyme
MLAAICLIALSADYAVAGDSSVTFHKDVFPIKSLPRPANDDIGAEMKNAPAYVGAEGALVSLIFKRATPDPKDKSKTYDRYMFDKFRIRNGQIVEHWEDEAK